MIFLKFDRRIFQNFDWTLLALVLSICAIGILNIYSTGFSASERQFPFYLKQIQWIVLGLILMMIIFLIDYRVIIQGRLCNLRYFRRASSVGIYLWLYNAWLTEMARLRRLCLSAFGINEADDNNCLGALF